MQFLDKILSKHIFLPIFDLVINRPGQHKDLYCRRCKCVTRHVSISHVEYFCELIDWSGNSLNAFVLLVFGKINDLNPVSNLTMGRPHRCMRCSNVRLSL